MILFVYLPSLLSTEYNLLPFLFIRTILLKRILVLTAILHMLNKQRAPAQYNQHAMNVLTLAWFVVLVVH